MHTAKRQCPGFWVIWVECQINNDADTCLCFSDDRLVTHWLKVIGKHAPAAPLLDIELTQRADVLISAKAKASLFDDIHTLLHAIITYCQQ